MSAPVRHERDALATRIKAGDRVALARGISLIESGDPDGLALSEMIFADGGRAHIIGITGPPGAGKSTLADALVRAWRARGLPVAVLAVDPVSPRTGGATLGDRTRMTASAADRGVFIRSSA
ncbi:MAG: AAA family ATPase, partial [Thermomicrobia bacterium]|nr:AAA family ATPase [Thermomicrobia bacterium]